MKRLTIPLIAAALMLTACATTSNLSSESPRNAAGSEGKPGVTQIAVILPIDDNPNDIVAADVMIGINRLARDFDGTIHGREETVEFGEKVDFHIFTTRDLVNGGTVGNLTASLRGFGLERFGLVIGSGFHYAEPFFEIHKEYPNTKFVNVDGGFDGNTDINLTSLWFIVHDAAFLAGAMAADRFDGRPLGAIGGMDMDFIRNDFISGFIAGVAYMDSVNGTRTEVQVEFADSFGDYEQGYALASDMYDRGVLCIYQVAGGTGYGILDAARDKDRWAIGVDIDQGLEAALGGARYEHILTSTVKKWGNGVYLVCREYLSTGRLPEESQFVGLAEDCTGFAINPYNAPILGNQLEMIEELKDALVAGELPDAGASPREPTVWKAIEERPAVEILTVTVNDPILSPGIPAHYAGMLQESLSTEFYKVGLYRVIDSEQVDRLLREINFSLGGVSEESVRLEVGRLVAAEAIVFVNLGKIGESVNVDCKLVDVETGLMISAARNTYPDFKGALDGTAELVRDLGRR